MEVLCEGEVEDMEALPREVNARKNVFPEPVGANLLRIGTAAKGVFRRTSKKRSSAIFLSPVDCFIG